MITTIEISLYPFQRDYRKRIQRFVRELEQRRDLRVTTGPTSTVVTGEHDHVMQSFTELVGWGHRELGRAAFVAKFLPDYDPETAGDPDEDPS